MSIISNKAVKRDKAAEQAIKKRQQARKMLERIKELESLIFECSTIGVSK
jgi:Mg2+ and Co2+ transporter CorA